MGDSVMSVIGNETELRNCSGESRVLGLDDYGSDQQLAALELFRCYPDGLLQFASACCVLFMVVGIPGNLITIIALARYKKVHNATAIFIINLSCSDLLLCCFNQPLAATTFWMRSWEHGKMLCRLFPLARYGLVAVSLFSVLAITINRYILMSHPRLYLRLYTKINLSIMVAIIWIFSFGALIPTYFEVWGRFSMNPTIGSCTIIPDINDRTPKEYLFLVAFILPCLAIVVCYARIIWIVRKAAKKTHDPIRLRPPTILEETESVAQISSANTKHVNTRNEKAQFKLNCLYNPTSETSSTNYSSSQEDDKDTPEIKPRTLGNEPAKRFRQSFVATFKRSTAYIKPRLPTKKDKKLLTMIVAILVSFCVCHLPITLMKTLFQFTSHPFANIAGYVLIYLTTCINPIIYVVMSGEYRQAYKNLFKCSR